MCRKRSGSGRKNTEILGFEVIDVGKKIAFLGLLTIAFLILIFGLVFSIYCFSNNITFKMMGSDVPGFIFGLAAIFLGVRYIVTLNKLKKKIEETDARFSWDNFRK